jgi:hypothetical protein
VFIRADNARWLDIRRKQGFSQIGTKCNETWADGTTGDTHVFKLDLRAPASEQRRTHTVQHLDKTLTDLTQGEPAPSALPEGKAISRSRRI